MHPNPGVPVSALPEDIPFGGAARPKTDSESPSLSAAAARIALVGNPNTGKTTLFNVLTGFRQRVGNYPGVTVEMKVGVMQGEGACGLELVDLPGAYSLAAASADEVVVLDVLTDKIAACRAPDVILAVVDATNLRRNLFLVSQLLELNRPVVVALNMVDLAQREGLTIDGAALERELGCTVIPVVATRKQGVAQLRQALAEAVKSKHSCTTCPSFPACVCAELDGLTYSVTHPVEVVSAAVPIAVDQAVKPGERAHLLQVLLDPGGYHEQELVKHCGRRLSEELAHRRERIVRAGESIAQVEARIRYAWIDRVLGIVVSRRVTVRPSRTQRADAILTHRVWGLLIFLGGMLICFQAIYTWAAPLMEAIDRAFAYLGGLLADVIPAGPLQSLAVNGVVAGVGAVLIFLPQIVTLFLFIALLEDCGYMARAAFLLDRWMGLLGLHGKSFIPLLSSFACAVPGIMATRTIEDRRDRLVTMLIAPLMSCSARLPVYVLLISAFVPSTALLGGLVGMQSVTLLAMYLVGVAVAIPMAWVLKKTLLKGPAQVFLMELPTYKWPTVSTVFFRVYGQAREFCIAAGTIIFAVTIVIWALGYYPRPVSIAEGFERQREALRIGPEGASDCSHEWSDIRPQANGAEPVVAIPSEPPRPGRSEGIAGELDESLVRESVLAPAPGAIPSDMSAPRVDGGASDIDARLAEIGRVEAGTYLRQSFLGRMGHLIEPVVKPLGWDWRIGMAVLAAFPAREVFVATLGTIYNLGSDADAGSDSLRGTLIAATWPDGTPVFNVPVALSLMVFFALCCQCGGTLATIKRETKSWGWTVFTFAYMTGLAYVAALATYQVARLVA